MSKPYARFVTALFCVFLGGFALLGVILPDRDFSPDENRILAQRPEITLQSIRSGKFMSDFEAYVTDQFPGRDRWIAGKAAAERFSGKHENNGVFFFKSEGLTYLIPRFDSPDEKRLKDNLGYVKRFAKESPIPVTVGLIPTAATVWADLLPQGAPNYDQRLILEQAAQAIPDFVDLYGVLKEHSGEPIYYRTDHHWTTLGAYYGYCGLAAALGYELSPLPQFETVTEDFYGTSYSSSGVRWVKPDSIQIAVPHDGVTVTSFEGNRAQSRQLYDYSKLEEKDKYAFFLGGQQPLCVIETPNQNKPRLLIIRDSYTDSLAPFLTREFSEIHLVDLRYYKGSLGDYIRENTIDRALVLYSVPNFVSDTNLAWLTR